MNEAGDPRYIFDRDERPSIYDVKNQVERCAHMWSSGDATTVTATGENDGWITPSNFKRPLSCGLMLSELASKS